MKNKFLALITVVIMTVGMLSGCSFLKPAIEDIVFTENEYSVAVGESFEIEYKIYPSSQSDASLTWQSSNEKIATVENGIVTGVSVGTASILAVSENGISASCVVEVVKSDNSSDNTNSGDNENPNNGNNGDGTEENNKGDVTYTISVVTKGGMSLSDVPVYIHEYEDGMIGEIVNYVITDATGKATVNLPENGSYAANISIGIPDGYDADAFYPLVSTNLNIEISSEVLPNNGLIGTSYTLGSVMQDFTVTTTAGEKFTLSEVLKEKKAVLLNFWYTECSWCMTEFPLMQKAYEKYKDDLAIIALDPPQINNDTIHDITQVKSFYGLTFDIALDEIGLFSAFGVEGYPTSVMIDRYGVVTLIELGAITNERVFDEIFKFFTSDDYKQTLVNSKDDIISKIKPDVQMPSSEEISNVFDKGIIPGIEYLPYPDSASDDEKENSWPFVIDTVDGEKVIKVSNTFISESFAQMVIKVPMKMGEVLAFDYRINTEQNADILYVKIDNKECYSFDGLSNGWQTCYAFVADDDGVYEITIIYSKDGDTNGSGSTESQSGARIVGGYTGSTESNYPSEYVYLKNLRLVDEDDIDIPTYIYRFAVTKPNGFGEYTDHVNVFMGVDGYYHVDSPAGPILLADLMGYTRFSDESAVCDMANDLLATGDITAAEYDLIINYCNYASNSQIYGASSVTEELKDLLVMISTHLGVASDPNDWLRFCFYYDAYGTNGKQLEDPIKGLAIFSAPEVIISDPGATDYPNSFTYNRVIMPRGFVARFTPTVSGTYYFTSYAPDPNSNYGYCLETEAYVYVINNSGEKELWYTYEISERQKINNNDNNCYFALYLEAGKDYYISMFFADVYQEGMINFRVERLGDEGYYRFTLASPGYFTPTGEGIVRGGIDATLGNDGIWREARTDGRVGSILYADFTMKTPVFIYSITQLIDRGAFNFGLSEGDQYILNYLAMNDNDPEKCTEYLKVIWGEDYDEYAEIYKISEVYEGIYHGEGKDYTAIIKGYLDKVIVEGYNEQLGETIAKDDPRIGCVVVTEELAEILQLLMDKYTFDGIEKSWLKLCYYSHYFCDATPK